MEHPDARIEANRRLWDERVPIHVDSDFYDTEGFVAGDDRLLAFELDELGPVEGRSLVHLQCHFGLDTLAWARAGAGPVVGVDISSAAVEAARHLAARIGVEAEFVESDVDGAPEALGGRTFDVVYTGLGALNWLPDLDAWASVVRRLLAPAGRFYLVEFHPFAETLGGDDLTITDDYWGDPGGHRDDDGETYTGGHTAHTESWEWYHPLSEVVTALLGQGLRLELLHEHPTTVYRQWPFLVEVASRRFTTPDGQPRLPLLYSMRWVGPERGR